MLTLRDQSAVCVLKCTGCPCDCPSHHTLCRRTIVWLKRSVYGETRSPFDRAGADTFFFFFILALRGLELQGVLKCLTSCPFMYKKTWFNEINEVDRRVLYTAKHVDSHELWCPRRKPIALFTPMMMMMMIMTMMRLFHLYRASSKSLRALAKKPVSYLF